MGNKPPPPCTFAKPHDGTNPKCTDILWDDYNVDDTEKMAVLQYGMLEEERIDPWSTFGMMDITPCQNKPSRTHYIDDALVLSGAADEIALPDELRFSRSSMLGVVVSHERRKAVFENDEDLVVMNIDSQLEESAVQLECIFVWDGVGTAGFGVVPHACASESVQIQQGRFAFSNGATMLLGKETPHRHEDWQPGDSIRVVVTMQDYMLRWWREGVEQPPVQIQPSADMLRFNFVAVGKDNATINLMNTSVKPCV